MALMDTISADIAAAMRARDQTRLAALRMAKAALMNREIERGRALVAPEVVTWAIPGSTTSHAQKHGLLDLECAVQPRTGGRLQ